MHPNLARSFDRLFDDSFDRFFAPATAGRASRAARRWTWRESERAYTVKLDLPGVAKEDVKISIDGRRVSVEAQTRKEEEKKEGDRVVYRERSMSSYARSFTRGRGGRPGRVGGQAGKRRADADAGQAWRAAAARSHRQLSAALRSRVAVGFAPVADACRLRPARGPSAAARRRRRRARPAARPRCQRMAAASAIIAPLSVHSASSG